MKYEEFLDAVSERGGPTGRAHADQATRSVLDVLGKRLAGGEPHDLASQLPVELQYTLIQHTGGPAEISDDLEGFCRRVAEHEGRNCTPDEALAHARAVVGTLASFVSAGEIDDLKTQLPPSYDALFPPAA
jgi:uncharacterized protein (DUF2267 family)